MPTTIEIYKGWKIEVERVPDIALPWRAVCSKDGDYGPVPSGLDEQQAIENAKREIDRREQ